MKKSLQKNSKYNDYDLDGDGIVTDAELENAKEVFITSSSHLVCPVIKIDNNPIGSGAIGALTDKLKQRFLKISQGQDSFFNNWLESI